ncbi:winged helix-turn-helix domain-containing protein [Saccharopolyspora dendranthemae]|uniref:Regulatory GntR family protein n=1 Tax=Saccharopolyspora dendranthemae TaxID=1181886 RepID=A0A561U4Z2_9PSEU|nr:GntR family transcriptional regulator [Saccharopolyspora dendranthemae]TWF94431.1 regulatory GntR family protein [Saccharopolyspora dendranthemae]
MSWESRADRINRDLPVYVWSQIADDLRADIDSGELTPGQRLPSGPELAEIYGVTKVTATKAIRHLQEAGLLIVVNGMGTYVTAG